MITCPKVSLLSLLTINRKVIQFGYLTLFTCAFPLAPCLALLNNMSELRVGKYFQSSTLILDSFRILTQHQRPVSFRASSIGLWRDLLNWTSHAAILISSLTIAFSSEWFTQNFVNSYPEDAHLGVRLAFVLLFEHTVLLTRWIFKVVVPDIPQVVHEKLDRDDYFQRVENGDVLDEPDNEKLYVKRMRNRMCYCC